MRASISEDGANQAGPDAEHAPVEPAQERVRLPVGDGNPERGRLKGLPGLTALGGGGSNPVVASTF